jgi:hypothetical protein
MRRNMKTGTTVLFTGHSAGGAIASLLYAHLGADTTSLLKEALTKASTVHCIVFGTPPVSLKPLERYRKRSCDEGSSLFLSLINEGDPIVKADREYLVSKCHWRNLRPWRPAKAHKSAAVVATASPIRRRLKNSGTVIFLRRGTRLPKVCEVDNEALEKSVPLSYSAHRISAYKKQLACYGDDLENASRRT